MIGDLTDDGALCKALGAATRSSTWRRTPTSGSSSRTRTAPSGRTRAAPSPCSRPAARDGRRRVVYGSTIWVYGESTDEPVTEESGLGLPKHIYTASKLAGEMYCASYAELYGLEPTILRFGIPYGRARARRRDRRPSSARRSAASR